MRFLLFLLFLMLPGVALGQTLVINCQENDGRYLLVEGRSLVSPCDSLFVLTKETYRRLFIESRQSDDLIARHEAAQQQLEKMSATQDSLINTQRQELEAYERYRLETQQNVDSLMLRLDESTANTDRAIRIARRSRMAGLLAGGGVGVLAGLLVGALAF
jgi:hypothetical protein